MTVVQLFLFLCWTPLLCSWQSYDSGLYQNEFGCNLAGYSAMGTEMLSFGTGPSRVDNFMCIQRDAH